MFNSTFYFCALFLKFCASVSFVFYSVVPILLINFANCFIEALEIACVSSASQNCVIYNVNGNFSDINHITISNSEHWQNVQQFVWFADKDEITLPKIPPAVFNRFPKLRKFRLSAGVPEISFEDFQNATHLRELVLAHNRIEKITNSVFSNAKHLEDINLNDNSIETLEDGAFRGLGNLKHLSLKDNLISTITPRAFEGLGNLLTLRLSDNQIDNIEYGAFNFPFLQELRLDDNLLLSIDDHAFSQIQSLKVLNLADNILDEVPNAIITAPWIEKINFNKNILEAAHLPEFAKVKGLKNLQAKNNYLELSSNATRQEPSASSLEVINLAWNHIDSSDILNHLSIFGQLKRIELKGNSIRKINAIEDVKTIFPMLYELDVHRNEIDDEWLGNVTEQVLLSGLWPITESIPQYDNEVIDQTTSKPAWKRNEKNRVTEVKTPQVSTSFIAMLG